MESTMAKHGKYEAKRSAYDISELALTPREYFGLQEAFTFLNVKLFESALPDVFLTLQRRAKSGGYFSPDRFTLRSGVGERQHEVALNPDIFTAKTDEFIVSILCHEMVHLWQHVRGVAPKHAGYHDKQWAAKMESLGLMPSNNGMVGGRRTGIRMQHYILEGGLFQQVFAELAGSGWKLHLESTPYRGDARAPSSKTKFTCSTCGQNVWGKPDTAVTCTPCGIEMRATVQL
jgi:hypothetical protein